MILRVVRVQNVMEIEEFTRFPLAHLPTPMYPLRRLTEYLGGPEIWIKRDDCTGLAGGGNKTRKLEYLIADAKAQGADTMLTVGAIQSNHTRQTAAAAAVAGMRCKLVQRRWVKSEEAGYESVGNILLSRILGAEIEIVPGAGRIDLLDDVFQHAVQSAIDAGLKPYVVPAGGSDHPLGGLGYVRCAHEILEQSKKNSVDFHQVIHATSSGSTQAGLIVGLHEAGANIRVIGIEVNGMGDSTEATVSKIVRETAKLLHVTADEMTVDVRRGYAGQSYGLPTAECLDAIELVARLEGILLDPVYEGKSMAALIALIRSGELRRRHKVLFMHLGGTPALHAYTSSFERHSYLHRHRTAGGAESSDNRITHD